METYIPSDAPVVYATPDAAYARELETLAPNITTLVGETRSDDESWTDTVLRILPSIAATWQQKQLLQVQVERARAGLPPLDVAQYSGASVNVGVTPDMRNLLIAGGLGVLALVWFMGKR